MEYFILYVDSKKDNSVFKALKKEGKVLFAPDVNEALYLIAENEFDYFFVCADTPQARGFLKHLKHDPSLPPPRAVVLLTENPEEDCKAWEVDTFVTKSRAKQDIPYVFSHMRGGNFEKAKVIRIAPDWKGSESRASRRLALQVSDVKGVEAPSGLPSPEAESKEEGVKSTFETHEEIDDALEPVKEIEASNPEHQIKEHILDEEVFNRAPTLTFSEKSTMTNNRRKKIFLAASLAFIFIAFAIFYFLKPWSVGKENNSVNKKSISAESSNERKKKGELLKGYGESESLPASETPSPNEVETKTAITSPDNQPGWESESSGDTPSPPPPPPPQENRAPTVTISGPTQVLHGDVATYTASASDPDGDSISYSWGSSTKNMCWSTPGVYTVSVTVTDSKGASASASITVTVI